MKNKDNNNPTGSHSLIEGNKMINEFVFDFELAVEGEIQKAGFIVNVSLDNIELVYF